MNAIASIITTDREIVLTGSNIMALLGILTGAENPGRAKNRGEAAKRFATAATEAGIDYYAVLGCPNFTDASAALGALLKAKDEAAKAAAAPTPKAPRYALNESRRRAALKVVADNTTPKKAKAASGTSKVAIIKELLLRPEGTTTEEVLKATGWPAVSMPQQAKAAKLELTKTKEKGQNTRYYGKEITLQ